METQTNQQIEQPTPPSKKWSKKFWAIFFGLIVFVMLRGFGSSSTSSTSATQSNNVSSSTNFDSDLVKRCVDAAIDEGYRNGRCSYLFINSCVTTQSKSEMNKWLTIDKLHGAITISDPNYCTGHPETYLNAFNRELSLRDKF